MTRPALLLPLPRTSTAVLLGEAATWRGIDVLPAPPPAADPARSLHWYGGPPAADRLADRLGLALLEPADAWLTGLPYELDTVLRASGPRDRGFIRCPSGG
ncbi:hypothetical protein NLX86_15150 [Streptomyces sp. A3M-1-3]|uniref:hypothetical protein n=1 Tax=Streptomyces sp. A3M-1-3 TaxID=2962044 RepID=UPI0020B68980|nr:hypothetical protein [Streptomyces sp. A3M-1-3]MCP3819393.1 hypothetical protein [Streptomyces sp. A3M-1-3]